MAHTPISGRSTPFHLKELVSSALHRHNHSSGTSTPTNHPHDNDSHNNHHRAKDVGAHMLNALAQQVHDIMKQFKHEKESEAHRVGLYPRHAAHLIAHHRL